MTVQTKICIVTKIYDYTVALMQVTADGQKVLPAITGTPVSRHEEELKKFVSIFLNKKGIDKKILDDAFLLYRGGVVTVECVNAPEGVGCDLSRLRLLHDRQISKEPVLTRKEKSQIRQAIKYYDPLSPSKERTRQTYNRYPH